MRKERGGGGDLLALIAGDRDSLVAMSPRKVCGGPAFVRKDLIRAAGKGQRGKAPEDVRVSVPPSSPLVPAEGRGVKNKNETPERFGKIKRGRKYRRVLLAEPWGMAFARLPRRHQECIYLFLMKSTSSGAGPWQTREDVGNGNGNNGAAPPPLGSVGPARLSPEFLCPNSLGSQARADPGAAGCCFPEILGFYTAWRRFWGNLWGRG